MGILRHLECQRGEDHEQSRGRCKEGISKKGIAQRTGKFRDMDLKSGYTEVVGWHRRRLVVSTKSVQKRGPSTAQGYFSMEGVERRETPGRTPKRKVRNTGREVLQKPRREHQEGLSSQECQCQDTLKNSPLSGHSPGTRIQPLLSTLRGSRKQAACCV